MKRGASTIPTNIGEPVTVSNTTGKRGNRRERSRQRGNETESVE